jgi:hypothetical protein
MALALSKDNLLANNVAESRSRKQVLARYAPIARDQQATS